jgi:hypothetical protein
MERLRIEAQEKEAAASRAHELLILDRQIELAWVGRLNSLASMRDILLLDAVILGRAKCYFFTLFNYS